MTNSTDTELLKSGDTVHFYGSTSLVRDELLFSQPVITSYGSELILTESILQAYRYPEQESWLTRIGQPDRNGFILTGRGPWPEEKLRVVPGSPEHRAERDKAVAEVWDTFGPGYSAAKNAALAAVDETYGHQTDPHFFVVDYPQAKRTF